MFNLDNTTVKFTNFNARSELNGEERRPAADINCSAQLPNTVLDELAPGLLQMLYEAPKNPDLAEQANPDAPTALRFPQLGMPLDWALVLDNRKVTIDYGLGGDSNIVLPECKVHKFKFTPQNGGTVLFTWQISAHPDEKQAGWLYEHQQQEIVISIEAPPQDDTQPQLPTMSKKEKQAKAKQEAEQMFTSNAEKPEGDGSGLTPSQAWPFPDASGAQDAETAPSLNVE